MKFLAWIDLEATGGDERRDPILEVGLIITDRSLDDLRSLSLTINPEYSGPRYGGWKERLEEEPVVKEMHTSNGLLRDLTYGMSLAEAQASIIETFTHFGAAGEFMLAGSGVSWYDRRFLKEQMPRMEAWLMRSMLDVGVLRRFTRDVVARPDLVHPAPTKTRKAHRALSDIQHHLSEARHYRSVLLAAEAPDDEG